MDIQRMKFFNIVFILTFCIFPAAGQEKKLSPGPSTKSHKRISQENSDPANEAASQKTGNSASEDLLKVDQDQTASNDSSHSDDIEVKNKNSSTANDLSAILKNKTLGINNSNFALPPVIGRNDRLPDNYNPKAQAANSDDSFRWIPALKQSLLFLGIQHGYAFTQPKTRHALKGNFFKD